MLIVDREDLSIPKATAVGIPSDVSHEHAIAVRHEMPGRCYYVARFVLDLRDTNGPLLARDDRWSNGWA